MEIVERVLMGRRHGLRKNRRWGTGTADLGRQRWADTLK